MRSDRVGLAIAGVWEGQPPAGGLGGDPGRGTLSNSSLGHHARCFRHPSNRRSVRPPPRLTNRGCSDTGITEKKRTATVPKPLNPNRTHGVLGSGCTYRVHHNLTPVDTGSRANYRTRPVCAQCHAGQRTGGDRTETGCQGWRLWVPREAKLETNQNSDQLRLLLASPASHCGEHLPTDERSNRGSPGGRRPSAQPHRPADLQGLRLHAAPPPGSWA